MGRMYIEKVTTYDKNGEVETKLYPGKSFKFRVYREPEVSNDLSETIYLLFPISELIRGIDYSAPGSVIIAPMSNEAFFYINIYSIYRSAFDKTIKISTEDIGTYNVGNTYEIKTMTEEEYLGRTHRCEENLFWKENSCGAFFKYHLYRYGD